MAEIVRCPYCVEGAHFKAMVGGLDGRYICARCGHITRLNDPDFVCRCDKCVELSRMPPKVRR